jgi:Transmembrane Fragile-X-F protein
LETALGKSFAEFTPAEKELISKRYSVVPSTMSPEFEAAQKVKIRARHDMIKSGFRIAFVLLLLIQLDGGFDWNWWLIFTPFWIMTVLFCFANYQAFAEVRQMAMEKDPSLFGLKEGDVSTTYGAMGKDGASPTTLTDEEREEVKAQVMASTSRLCSKCCSQGFLVLIVLLFVGKIQGAGYSALLIISPVLLVVCFFRVLRNCFWYLLSLLTPLSSRPVLYCVASDAPFSEFRRYLPMVLNSIRMNSLTKKRRVRRHRLLLEPVTSRHSSHQPPLPW